MSVANVTETLVDWIAGLKFEDVPRRTIEEAKNQILSVIAAVHAGHFSEVGRTVRRAVQDWGGGKDATMIPSGERTSLYSAIFANTALSSALDYDDYMVGGHTGHVAVIATLALAEKLGTAGKDLLVAQILANEIEGRLGVAALVSSSESEAFSAAHLAGSAALAARLLGLKKEQIHAALGIALLQPGRALPAAYLGREAKAVAVGMSAPLGIQAAQLAEKGLKGGENVIEHPQGFLSAFSTQPQLGAFDSLGSVWLMETLCYKIYPGSAYLDTTIDCILDIVRQHSLDARKVKTVQVAASDATIEMGRRIEPLLRGPETPTPALHYHLAYNVAAALQDRELTARQFTPERVRDQALWNLAGRVQVTLDGTMAQRARDNAFVKRSSQSGEPLPVKLTDGDLARFRMSCGARVRVEMEDGRSFEAEEEIPVGAAGRSFDERRKSVEDKFRRETRYTLRKERMERAVDIILHIEETNAAQLRELIRLCCSERR
jgi:2-methylcitrate dehydratase PrpD